MQGQFAACLRFTLAREGGYQDNRADPGNWSGGAVGAGTLVGTRYGISAPVLAAWRGGAVDAAAMRDLGVAEAAALYRARFWVAVRGDDLPPGVDLMTFDMQANAGSLGAKCLQRAVGIRESRVDGVIGPGTLAALAALSAGDLARHWSAPACRAVQAALGLVADGWAGPRTLAGLQGRSGPALAICGACYDQHVACYRACAGFAGNGRGWLNRAAARLHAALPMALDAARNLPNGNEFVA